MSKNPSWTYSCREDSDGDEEFLGFDWLAAKPSCIYLLSQLLIVSTDFTCFTLFLALVAY